MEAQVFAYLFNESTDNNLVSLMENTVKGVQMRYTLLL